MHERYYKIIICGYLFALGQFGTAASATTELSKMRDCTEIELEAVIDQDASREDNLARLSQQFFQSLTQLTIAIVNQKVTPQRRQPIVIAHHRRMRPMM